VLNKEHQLWITPYNEIGVDIMI